MCAIGRAREDARLGLGEAARVEPLRRARNDRRARIQYSQSAVARWCSHFARRRSRDSASRGGGDRACLSPSSRRDGIRRGQDSLLLTRSLLHAGSVVRLPATEGVGACPGKWLASPDIASAHQAVGGDARVGRTAISPCSQRARGEDAGRKLGGRAGEDIVVDNCGGKKRPVLASSEPERRGRARQQRVSRRARASQPRCQLWRAICSGRERADTDRARSDILPTASRVPECFATARPPSPSHHLPPQTA